MAGKYIGPIQLRLSGDEVLASRYVGPARVIVQELFDQMDAFGTTNLIRRELQPDGTHITAHVMAFVEAAPMVQVYIHAPVITQKTKPTEPKKPISLRREEFISNHLFFYFDKVTNERWTLSNYGRGWVRNTPLPNCQLPPYKDGNDYEFDYGDCPYWVGNMAKDVILNPYVKLDDEGNYSSSGTAYLYGLGGEKIPVVSAKGYYEHAYSNGLYKTIDYNSGWVFRDGAWELVGTISSFVRSRQWNQSGTQALVTGSTYRIATFEEDTVSENILSAGPYINTPYTVTDEELYSGTLPFEENVPYPQNCYDNPFPACVAILNDPVLCLNTGQVVTTIYSDYSAYRIEESEFRSTEAVGFFRDVIFLNSVWTEKEKLTRGSTDILGNKIRDRYVNWGFPISHVACNYSFTVNGGHDITIIPGTNCEWEEKETIRSGADNIWFPETGYERINRKYAESKKTEAVYEFDIPGPGLTMVPTNTELQVKTVDKESSVVINANESVYDIVPKAGLLLTGDGGRFSEKNTSSSTIEDETNAVGCFGEPYLSLPTYTAPLETFRVYLEGSPVLTIPSVAWCEFFMLAHNSDLSSIFILKIFETWDAPAIYRFFGIYEGKCDEITNLVGPSLNQPGQWGGSICGISGLLPLRARNDPYVIVEEVLMD